MHTWLLLLLALQQFIVSQTVIRSTPDPVVYQSAYYSCIQSGGTDFTCQPIAKNAQAKAASDQLDGTIQALIKLIGVDEANRILNPRGLFVPVPKPSPGGVSSVAFTYYKLLTIQTGQVPSTQSHEPLVVPFLGGDADIKAAARSDGFDIRPFPTLTDVQNNTNQLNYELVWYDSSTGAFEMHIDMGASAVFDGATVYLGYGNSSITTDGSTPSTWDSNYLGVAHFGDGTTLSSLNSKTGGLARNNVAAAAGKVGGGLSNTFTGYMVWDATSPSTENVTMPASSDKTISFWFNVNSFMSIAELFNNNIASEEIQIYPGDGHLYWDEGNNTTGRVSYDYSSYQNAWTLITLVSKGDDSFGAIYLNGSPVVTRSIGASPSSSISGWVIPYPSTAAYVMDEYRLSKTVRSADWIKTEYNNQFAPTTFWSTGAQTAVSGGGGGSAGGPIVHNGSLIRGSLVRGGRLI